MADTTQYFQIRHTRLIENRETTRELMDRIAMEMHPLGALFTARPGITVLEDDSGEAARAITVETDLGIEAVTALVEAAYGEGGYLFGSARPEVIEV